MSTLKVDIIKKESADHVEIQDNVVITGSIEATTYTDLVTIAPYLVKTTLTPANSVAIDWTTCTKASCLLDRATTTFTFTAPTYPCALILVLTQDGTGGRVASFPVAVKWANQYATLSTAINAIDIVTIYWDGTTYFATLLNNFLTL